jgi:hypothetical protein
MAVKKVKIKKGMNYFKLSEQLFGHQGMADELARQLKQGKLYAGQTVKINTRRIMEDEGRGGVAFWQNTLREDFKAGRTSDKYQKAFQDYERQFGPLFGKGTDPVTGITFSATNTDKDVDPFDALRSGEGLDAFATSDQRSTAGQDIFTLGGGKDASSQLTPPAQLEPFVTSGQASTATEHDEVLTQAEQEANILGADYINRLRKEGRIGGAPPAPEGLDLPDIYTQGGMIAPPPAQTDLFALRTQNLNMPDFLNRSKGAFKSFVPEGDASSVSDPLRINRSPSGTTFGDRTEEEAAQALLTEHIKGAYISIKESLTQEDRNMLPRLLTIDQLPDLFHLLAPPETESIQEWMNILGYTQREPGVFTKDTELTSTYGGGGYGGHGYGSNYSRGRMSRGGYKNYSGGGYGQTGYGTQPGLVNWDTDFTA